MTRRKRTPSPPAPSSTSTGKRVAFEIPASLQHFSNISRSLATAVDSPAAHPASLAGANSPPPRASFAVTPPTAALAAQHAARHSNNPVSAASAAHPSPHPSMSHQLQSPTVQRWAQQAASRDRLPASPQGKAVGAGREKMVQAANSSPVAHTRANVSASPSPLARRVSGLAPPSTGSDEPPLQPGETPVLATHPHLIASLIAKKRAENEAKGHHQRLVNRQLEHKMSQSPAAYQPPPELNHVGAAATTATAPTPTSPVQTLPRPAPHPKAPPKRRSRPKKTAKTLKTLDDAVASEGDNEAETPSDGRRNSGDAVLGSHFSSPIAEFLEAATDDAGLKDTRAPNAMAAKQVAAAAAAARPLQSAHAVPTATNNAHPASDIPHLFSDKPVAAHQTHMYQNVSNSYPTVSHNSPATATATGQNHPPNNMSVPSQNSPQQSTFAGMAFASQPSPRPMQQSGPNFYAKAAPMSGYYYKMDFRNPSSGDRTMVATPTMPSSNHLAGPATPAYGRAPPMGNVAYAPYNIGMMYPYVMPTQSPSTPEQAIAYGDTISAAELVNPARPAPKRDTVGGINTKFKIATQHHFSVPKR